MSVFVKSGQFVFPDEAFPQVPAPFPGLPMAPQDKIGKIMSEYTQYVDKAMAGINQDSKEQIHQLFKWARETVDFAETQPGIATNVINTAMDIIRVVGGMDNSKFKGAALYMMGLWHLFGIFGVRASNTKAREMFMSSAKLGYSRALYRIGSDYEGRGDISTAIVYFEHGVKRGDAACYYRLAMAHLRGHLNKPVDTALGLKYLEKSSLISDPDCPQSAYMYGLIQLGELPYVVSTDPQVSTGIMALERSAWLGFAPAQIRMGKSWQGGEKGYDATVALRYFHLASRQLQYSKYNGDDASSGDSEPGAAEAEISKWFLCGSDGIFPPNEEWAYKFASLAAQEANPIAEFAVGYFYEVGIYVECNMNTALEWYKISAAHNCADAEQRLKDLENNDGSVEVERKITRKDHERTLSVKGRGSIRSSRKLVDKNKPVPPPPQEKQQQQPQEIVEVAEEDSLSDREWDASSDDEAPEAPSREPQQPTKFDFEGGVQLPHVESSPFTVELPAGQKSREVSPVRQDNQLNVAKVRQTGAGGLSPDSHAAGENGYRRTSHQPISNQPPRQSINRPFSVSLSDPPSQVQERMQNLSVGDLAPPPRSPSRPSSVASSTSSNGPMTPTKLSHVMSSETTQAVPPQPQQAPPPPPPPHNTDASSASVHSSTLTSSPASTMTSATSFGSSIDGDARQGPPIKYPTRIPSPSVVAPNRPQSAMVNNAVTPPPPTSSHRSSLPNAAAAASSSPSSNSTNRPSSAFNPYPSRSSPLSNSGGSSPALSEPPLLDNTDLRPPGSPSSSTGGGPNRLSQRSSMMSLGKMKTPSMLSLNGAKSPPKPVEPPLKPTVPAGQTPMTFEEMGVPKAKVKDKDCIIM